MSDDLVQSGQSSAHLSLTVPANILMLLVAALVFTGISHLMLWQQMRKNDFERENMCHDAIMKNIQRGTK